MNNYWTKHRENRWKDPSKWQDIKPKNDDEWERRWALTISQQGSSSTGHLCGSSCSCYSYSGSYYSSSGSY